jgi:hypothetical protein
MSDRKLMQQVLRELEGIPFYRKYGVRIRKAITALQKRLAHCDRCGKRLGGEGDIHTCTPDPIGDAQDRLIAEIAAQNEQELVGREAYMAIREARENASEDAYFAARPEHDKDLNRLMFRSGFYHGYPTTPPAQPATVQPEQKPVATVIKKGAERQWMSERMGNLPDGIYSLYTTPPAARTWVDLTPDDIQNCYGGNVDDFARALLAKSKERNT